MRILVNLSYVMLPALALVACAPPPPPESPVQQAAAANAGVGFNNPEAYRAARAQRQSQVRATAPAAAPATPAMLPPPIVELPGGESEPLESGNAGPVADLDPSVLAAVDRVSSPAGAPSFATAAAAVPGETAAPPAPAPALVVMASAEAARAPLVPSRQPTANGFDDDGNYVQVSASALPERPSETVNVVSYALGTTNAVGQPVHRRGGAFSQRKFERACGAYRSDDAAQTAFLVAGGPERDRLGVDPDGDGFACDWSPAPFRAAAGR